jgi:bifunctional UDP-N-acetylglucosamine pyrophosphorylase / glucosamine-1-phosphate N-acetyltransferase
MIETTVVILAAGLGTRMRSRRAKVLHHAGGLPLVEHVVRAARAVAEPERIIVVTGHQAERVEETLAPTGVQFARQMEQKGTGHALAQCANKAAHLGGQLMVLVGDAPLLSAETLVRLRDQQAASGTGGTLIATSVPDPTGYGRVILDAQGDVVEIVEHKACTPEQLKVQTINSAIYCLQADLVWNNLGKIQPHPSSGEYYLTDLFEILRKQGHRMGAILLDDPNELLGINTRVELAEADAILRARKRKGLLLAGITMEQPGSITIDMDVEVGQDTILEPGVRLLGATKVGAECRIGAGSILENMQLEDGVTVHPYSVLQQSHVSTGALIGPFARLRPNTHIGEKAEVGNFAELKNTRLGPGAKSHHVSYLGDADIGAKVNIGAGTIICNYDGTQKHRTSIGDSVFIGSNSTLVAPVMIHSESYVAAGSVITHDVPSDALALGRARQEVKPGWVAKRKAQKSK